jgi:RNA polymerase sigma-70 factor (ECF subfamily)
LYRSVVTTWGTTPLSECGDGDVARAVAATSGDAAAAESELYRRFAPRVRMFGLKHLCDRAAADDLAQQVMLVVITRLRAGEVREPDQIASFVLGTSRMIATGQQRGERRRSAIIARVELRHEAVEMEHDLALDSVRIAPCLQALRERERTVLLLTYYADKSAAEIAAAIGTTAGAVRVARHRALASMRNCIEVRRAS